MLSAQTTKNIADAFHRSVQATLVRSAADSCLIVPTAKAATDGKIPTKLLMITLSSFSFRLATVFQVAQEPVTRDYYTSGTNANLDEAFAEVANMCCGAFGRELSSAFKHLAMSIPYGLESTCVDHLSSLQPRFQSSYDITINSSVQIRAMLCMSCKRPIEFVPPAVVAVAHAGGELELF